jgi:hypothetical protein
MQIGRFGSDETRFWIMKQGCLFVALFTPKTIEQIK